MKALLIKTDERKIEEVEFNGTLEHAYELLGCEMIERITLQNNDDVWVDEEGLINGNAFGGFAIADSPILIGRGLITGTIVDEENGDHWGDVKTTLEEAQAETTFVGVTVL